MDERNEKLTLLKTQLEDLKQECKNKIEFSHKLDDLKVAYGYRTNELKQQMKFIASKIPSIIKEAKYSKQNYEELNGMKKDKMRKIDTLRNKREANLLKAVQAKK